MKWIKKTVAVVLLPLMMTVAASGVMAADQAPPPARVVTAPVIEQEVAETTQVVGTLFFDRISHLSTEVDGQVRSVHVQEGDRVKQGALMFRLSTDFIDNEMAQVRAAMAQVEVRLEKADKDLGRYETLFRKEAVSEREYDDMALSRASLVKQMDILKTQLALAQLKKEKSVIRSPFDGVVIEKTSETGDWVSPGSRLCTVGAVDALYVKVPVSESLLVFARKGMTVPVVLTALGKSVKGTLAGVVPVADPQTRTVFVKVALPVLENPVQNMSATVDMPVSDKKKMLLVPRDGLVSFNGQDMIYTVTAKGTAAPLPIKIRAYVGAAVAVEGEAGIQKGMPVVVDGNARLRPGQAVTVIQ